MKKRFIIGIIAAAIATGANAGVAEKKAQKAANEAVAQAAESTKSACGNAELKAVILWDKIDAIAGKNAEKMKSKNYDLQSFYSSIGKRSAATLEALSKICKDDADYKSEIAKVKSLSITAKEDFSDYKSAYTLEGTTITAQTGHYMSRSSSDFIGRLKDLF